MAELLIRPYAGFGVVDFDMTADEVEELLGPAVSRSPKKMIYETPRVCVYFDASSRCEMVDATVAGSPPGTVPAVFGVPLTDNLQRALDALAAKGYPFVEHDGEGAHRSDDLGIALWVEDPDSSEIYSVAAWRRDYWNEP